MEDAGRIRRGYFVDGLGAAQFALPGALDRLRAARDAGRASGARARCCSSPPRTRPTRTARRSPWPRRDEHDRRPLQRAAGAYVVLVDGVAALYLERGGSTLQTLPAADDPRSPSPRRGAPRSSSRTAASRSWSSARSTARTWPRRRSASAAGRRVRAGLPRPRPARRLVPEGDTLYRTAAGLRPYLVGRTVTAARAQGPGPVPQVHRVVGRTIDAVDSVGKNLLIRFDGGLELRTHLRMNGSWHRYRPGERWRRPPSRARLVLEVPGAVAVCFDAPVVELLETRAEALHPALGALGPDLLADGLRRRRGASPPARPVARRHGDRRGAARPAGARRHRQRLQERDPLDRAGLAVHAGRGRRRRDARPPDRDRPPAAARERPRDRGPERVTTAGDRGAPGALYVYGRGGRPCRRCRTPIRSTPAGHRTCRGRRTGARPVRARCTTPSTPPPPG